MKEDLNRLSVEALGMLFPIIIVEHDPAWKKLFFSEKQIILEAIGPENIIRIEHIGSTAVQGLCAKPTIDILVEIKDETDTGQMIEKLKQTGYYYTPKPENPPPHLMFMKGYSNTGYIGQAYHIHIRYHGDWDELVFRDYLIRNQLAAHQYTILKRKLSVDHRNNREEYAISKTDFIKHIVEKARKELKNKPCF